MSKREIDRFDIISRLLRRELNGTEAGRILHLCTRQIRRLKQAVKKKGAAGLIHGLRGKISNQRMEDEDRKKIAHLLREKYSDFGPTFAAEKLCELHRIDHDPKTIRTIQIEEGLWKPRRGKKKESHRSWRQRRSAFGEMLQFDGSYHDWFEGRGGIHEACLLAAIDDATSMVTDAEFAPHEGVFPVFAFWRRYLETQGKPRSIYLDKFSTYKMNGAAAKENPDLKTQFERAMRELQIEPIFANSPQAKGRIERLFDTFQDRLVKELRLADVSTVEEANKFLKEKFIPSFNTKFSVEPASSANLHRELTVKERASLPSIFSRQETRTVQNDFTFAFKNQWYQITEQQPVTVCKKDIVTAEEQLDGTIHFRLRGKELNVAPLPERLKRVCVPFVIPRSPSTPVKPSADHPWRQRFHADALRVKSFN
jgi:hypothetical protein